jgi:hypothetical protein
MAFEILHPAPFEIIHTSTPISPESDHHFTNIPVELLYQVVKDLDGDTVSLSEVNKQFRQLTSNDKKTSLRATRYDASKEPYGRQYRSLSQAIKGHFPDSLSSITIEQMGLPIQDEKVHNAITHFRDQFNSNENIFPKVSIHSFPDAIFVHITPRILDGRIIDKAAKNLAIRIANTISEDGPMTLINKSDKGRKGQIVNINLGNSFRRNTNRFEQPKLSDMPFSKQQHELSKFLFAANKPASFIVRLTVKSKNSPRALKRAASQAISDWKKDHTISLDMPLEVSSIKSSTHAVSVQITPKRMYDGTDTGPAGTLAFDLVNGLAGKGSVKVIKRNVTGAPTEDQIQINFANAFQPGGSQDTDL